MTKINISHWIQNAFPDDLSSVAALTIRADGNVKNEMKITKSAWSNGAAGSLHLLIKALDRTIAEISRGKNKQMKFVAFLGGDSEKEIAGHFHAILQFPPNVDQEEFLEKFRHLWFVKVTEALKTQLKTSVYSEPLLNKAAFSAYCQRYEGTTLARGSDKVVMSRSMML